MKSLTKQVESSFHSLDSWNQNGCLQAQEYFRGLWESDSDGDFDVDGDYMPESSDGFSEESNTLAIRPRNMRPRPGCSQDEPRSSDSDGGDK